MKTSTSLFDSSSPPNIWVLRAGKVGDCHSIFLKFSVIALDDQGMGDLNLLSPSREAFYAAYSGIRPNDSRISITGIAGKYFRFSHELGERDFVLYPATSEKRLYVGTVVGAYAFNLELSEMYPHQRAVEWLGSIDIASLSTTARQELGAARMIFQVRRHEPELRKWISKILLKKSESAGNSRGAE